MDSRARQTHSALLDGEGVSPCRNKGKNLGELSRLSSVTRSRGTSYWRPYPLFGIFSEGCSGACTHLQRFIFDIYHQTQIVAGANSKIKLFRPFGLIRRDAHLSTVAGRGSFLVRVKAPYLKTFFTMNHIPVTTRTSGRTAKTISDTAQISRLISW